MYFSFVLLWIEFWSCILVFWMPCPYIFLFLTQYIKFFSFNYVFVNMSNRSLVIHHCLKIPHMCCILDWLLLVLFESHIHRAIIWWCIRFTSNCLKIHVGSINVNIMFASLSVFFKKDPRQRWHACPIRYIRKFLWHTKKI